MVVAAAAVVVVRTAAERGTEEEEEEEAGTNTLDSSEEDRGTEMPVNDTGTSSTRKRRAVARTLVARGSALEVTAVR